MNDRVFLGKIHKVTFGPNPGLREAMGYTVGRSISNSHSHIIVTSIILDDYLYEKYGKVSCIIWVVDTKKDNNVEFIYKTYIDIPLCLCSNID